MFGALLLNEMWPLKTICSAFLAPQLQIFEEMAVPTSEKAHWKASYAVKETTDLFIKKKKKKISIFQCFFPSSISCNLFPILTWRENRKISDKIERGGRKKTLGSYLYSKASFLTMLFWFYANFCGAHENYLQEKKKKKRRHQLNTSLTTKFQCFSAKPIYI